MKRITQATIKNVLAVKPMTKTLLNPGEVMNYAIDVLGFDELYFEEMSVDEFWESLDEDQKREAMLFNS